MTAAVGHRMRRTQIWAHRGARQHAPENTLPAFELALAQGADGIEFDVQLTADGVPVLIHDETVDRTTDGTGQVAELDFATLRRLDASAGRAEFGPVRIPTLDEALDLLLPSSAMLNIELKNTVAPYPGLEEIVLAAVAERGILERVVLSTFNHDSLKRLRQLDSHIELGMLHQGPLYRPWSHAMKLGVAGIHPPARYVFGPGYVRRAHDAGLAVRPWVVNGGRRLSRLFAWGVDGVFTDVPADAVAAREKTR